MTSRLNFLVAARQCEIGELEQLARTSELVGVVGRLVHALQRERGISNIYLGSHGVRYGDQRLQQVLECERAAQDVLAQFDLLDTETGRVRNGARLFSRVAIVLHALDTLPALRQRIATQALTPREATVAFVRLIAGLLAVVFEAADSATDPEISRALVALFNFMQGKEFAGQERACGAAVFASGQADLPSQQQWRHLIESQDSCFQVFQDFSDAAVLAACHASQDASVRAEQERLRRVGCTARAEAALDPGLSQTWYECCTRRIDAMKTVEDVLEANLRRLCERRILQAREELRDQQAILEDLSRQAGGAGPGMPTRYGPHLERSILGMVQEQAQRLQAMSDELDTVRATLKERKVVERAKGLLMAHRQLTEEEAYKTLRQMAMNQKRRLIDVAEAVLALAQALPAGR
ncbi:nitrate regulatory protein [uncultured Ramlibacter sp.]|uniref:nitrate regulatory protein n=1 Tax=uncultured Ramlibacter sp. TaxID=260755 RepID=UPI00261EDD12|nr:nitrate regulatory protein [uncultured Ramlibacter sp.]